MLTVTNGSSLVELKYTANANGPYLKAHTSLFFLDLNSEVADDIIEMFKSGEMDEITNISIFQYDFYRDINEFKEGLAKLFEYFIFYNQWFVENHLNVIYMKEEFRNATSEQVLESQKTITITGKKWPEDSNRFHDLSELETELRGSILLTKESPLEAIRLTANFTDSYIEDKDELDPTKDRGTMIYHHHTFIQHDIVTMETVMSIARFYGELSTTTREPNGDVIFDIWKIIRETEEWVAPDISEGGNS